MTRKRHTEVQIVFAFQQADSAVAVAEVCQKLGVAETTHYH